MTKRLVLLLILVSLVGGILLINTHRNSTPKTSSSIENNTNEEDMGGLLEEEHPLQIAYMRKQTYPGSDITIEQTLEPGINYQRYLVSYKSDGLKIFALLTVPNDSPSTGSGRPAAGWPVVIFNHGYIPPEQYRTTERYIAYTDAFSRNGYIVFRSDYRGHGNSEGNPEGGYYSPAYTIDVMNGLASVKKLREGDLTPTLSFQERGKTPLLADPNRIGMWGHSMGGSLTLRSMVIDKNIRAGVIWAGVVADYKDMATNWRRTTPFTPSQREQATRRGRGRQALIEKYGDFDKNPDFWHSIAPIYFVKDLSSPIQVHHGTEDEDVPVLFSQRLESAMKQEGKSVELYIYEGDDHNLAQNLGQALQRSVDFFDRYVKGE